MSTVHEQTQYLGYPITLRERTLAIFDRANPARKIYDGKMTFSGARRFIRAYRKAS